MTDDESHDAGAGPDANGDATSDHSDPESPAPDEGDDTSDAEDGVETEETPDGEAEPETEPEMDGATEADVPSDTDEVSETDGESDDSDDVEESSETADVPERAVTVESLRERIAAIEERLAEAETEADLDDVAADLNTVETDLDGADLDPEAVETEEDEDDVDPAEIVGADVEELKEELASERGPYVTDVVDALESIRSTVVDTEWVPDGIRSVRSALGAFLDTAEDALDRTFDRPEGPVESSDDDPTVDADETVTALDAVTEALETADLDPDEDAETIATLLEATETLETAVDDADAWDDLTKRERLDAHGFYDVLEHRKDFPPEWNAVKVFEQRGDPGPILVALELLDSEFMERHCVEALKRLGAPEALDAMQQRAQRRDKPAIEVLGKIGSDDPLEMLEEYAATDSDPGLQKVTLRALGEIGSREATQTVADRLANDNPEVRSRAARALGMIGDTRAVAPLADTLENDETDRVRASAAWALRQIGTERALEIAADYATDRAYLVQAEAERAARPVR